MRVIRFESDVELEVGKALPLRGLISLEEGHSVQFGDVLWRVCFRGLE